MFHVNFLSKSFIMTSIIFSNESYIIFAQHGHPQKLLLRKWAILPATAVQMLSKTIHVPSGSSTRGKVNSFTTGTGVNKVLVSGRRRAPSGGFANTIHAW